MLIQEGIVDGRLHMFLDDLAIAQMTPKVIKVKMATKVIKVN